MNYSTLFPEMVKSLPKFEEKDMCYHYQQKNNDNKNMKVYIPSGKKILLWFEIIRTNVSEQFGSKKYLDVYLTGHKYQSLYSYSTLDKLIYRE